MCLRSLSFCFVVLGLTGCAEVPPQEPEDNKDDSFVVPGATDQSLLTDEESLAVIKVANESSLGVFVDDIGLNRRTANNIIKYRAGVDGSLATSDDESIDDLAELDAIAYVGRVALDKLLAYAKESGYVDGPDDKSSDAGPTPPVNAPCIEVHDGKTPRGDLPVTICTRFFDEAPRVHLPPNTSSVFYGAISHELGWQLRTSDGKRRNLLTPTGTNFNLAMQPKGMGAPENMNLIYRVTATPDAMGALIVTKLEPYLWLDSDAIASAALGAWEGTVSLRTGTNQYDRGQPGIAIRIEFSSLDEGEIEPVWKSMELPNQKRLLGSITNWGRFVRASNGTCLAPLSTLTDTHPYFGATSGVVALYRHPNMHGLNDQVTVMQYPSGSAELSHLGMGSLGFALDPSRFIQIKPENKQISLFPHATPNGHVVSIGQVEGGGEPCSP